MHLALCISVDTTNMYRASVPIKTSCIYQRRNDRAHLLAVVVAVVVEHVGDGERPRHDAVKHTDLQHGDMSMATRCYR